MKANIVALILMMGVSVIFCGHNYCQDKAAFITGKVVTEQNDPIPSATVTVKGSIAGTSTNAAGEFSLKVSSQTGKLVVSSVGYNSAEVDFSVENNVKLHIVLLPQNDVLDQILVVGYGTQSKVTLTGAVSSIGGEELLKRTTSNLQQSLQARIPGLTVLDQGAAPGKMNMVMRIRGITTLGANEPLVIVDGIEQNFNFINPEDIETISVLKDASSTAIYGSRAANGVILISTKRGKKGRINVEYNGYYALQKGNNIPQHMGLEDYLRLQNVAWINSTGNPIYSEEYIQEFIHATDRLKYPLPYAWHDVVLKTAPQISNNITISGGNDNVKSRLSARYLDQDGIVANTYSKIAELRFATDYRASNKLSVGFDFNYRGMNNKAPNNEFILFKSLLQNAVFTVPRYPDGTLGVSADGRSPLIFAELDGVHRSSEDYLAAIGNIKWEIIKGLQFSSQLGGRLNFFKGKNYRNKFEIRDYFNPSIIKLNQPQNSLVEVRNDFKEYTITNLLRYDKDFDDHQLNVLLGYSQIQNNGANLAATRQNFYNNDIQSLSAGANDGTKDNTGADSDWGLRSYFSRVNYTFMNKYLFEANSRYDGSSRFVGNNKYSFFPSFSAGWRLSQEKWWESSLRDKIQEFKLRASWGKTGNQTVPLYSYLKTLLPTTYSFNGNVVQGYTESTLANQDITWETTTQADIGLDAQFYKRKVSVVVDYYYKKTEGILLSLPIPGTMGLLPSPQNAGRLDNFGWEISAGYNDVFNDIRFSATFAASINNNKVINLAGTGPYISGGNETRYIIGEGYPYNSYWGYTTEGYFQTKEETASYPKMRPDVMPGDVKFVDLNNDGKITPDDMKYLGRSFPKYLFNSNLGIGYKGLHLSVLLQGVGFPKVRPLIVRVFNHLDC